jgi:hypothetical protein
MYGWQSRPCTNLHGMYRWFGVVPQGREVLFSSFFVVIFEALCCDFLGRVLRMISWGFCWVSRMRTLCPLAGDFAPKSPLNRTRFGGFSSWLSSCPRETISLIPLDC